MFVTRSLYPGAFEGPFPWSAPRMHGRCLARDVHGHEAARRDAAQRVVAGLAGADEPGDQLLLLRRRVALGPMERDRRPAARVRRRLGLVAELVVRHGGRVDERALRRRTTADGNVEP